MNIFSCIINFRDNFTKNMPYYTSLLSQMSEGNCSEYRIDEHSAFGCGKNAGIFSKICEGYQFTSVFSGDLQNASRLKSQLSALGYDFLTDSDAELALTAYIHYGEKCSGQLYGSFTLVVYDFMRRQTFALSSPSAPPVFYLRDGDKFILSPHPCSFFALPGITPKISRDALRELLLMPRHLSGNIFEGVYMLPAGHVLRIREDSAAVLSCCEDVLSCHPIGLPETAREAAAVIGEGISDRHEAGIILDGSRRCCAVLSLAAEKTRRLSSYSFSSENLISRASGTYHSHLPFSEDALRMALKESVTACGLPVFARDDFLLPMILRRTPQDVRTIYSSSPSLADSNICNSAVLLRNRAFLPAVAETLELSQEDSAHENSFLNYAAMIAADGNINLKTPLASQRLALLLHSVPYSADSVFTEILRQKSGIIPLAHAPVWDAPALRRILLEILARDSSPISAFFDKSALLKLCEDRFDFSGSNAVPSELIAYIIKLNFWFEEYRPRII
ncbi:MAG: hypothetical protein PUE13_08105 [Clostridiales bacterium]|nr:hypothetical protein [Clostridiales bacterium]